MGMMVQERFFYMHWKENDSGGIAHSAATKNIEFVEQLRGLQKVPFVFSIKDGPYQDYLANNLGWPLMSERLKGIIDSKAEREKPAWIIAEVISESSMSLNYFVPLFSGWLDVLNHEKSIITKNNLVIKAHLSKDKVCGLEFFPVPGSAFRIIISERIKKEIEKHKITGVDFSLVPLS
jgi:hypothetical protein